MTATATERVLLDEEALQRTLRRIAHEIVEKHPDLEQLNMYRCKLRRNLGRYLGITKANKRHIVDAAP